MSEKTERDPFADLPLLGELRDRLETRFQAAEALPAKPAFRRGWPGRHSRLLLALGALLLAGGTATAAVTLSHTPSAPLSGSVPGSTSRAGRGFYFTEAGKQYRIVFAPQLSGGTAGWQTFISFGTHGKLAEDGEGGTVGYPTRSHAADRRRRRRLHLEPATQRRCRRLRAHLTARRRGASRGSHNSNARWLGAATRRPRRGILRARGLPSDCDSAGGCERSVLHPHTGDGAGATQPARTRRGAPQPRPLRSRASSAAVDAARPPGGRCERTSTAPPEPSWCMRRRWSHSRAMGARSPTRPPTPNAATS